MHMSSSFNIHIFTHTHTYIHTYTLTHNSREESSMMSGWALKADPDSDDEGGHAHNGGGGNNKNRRKSVEMRCGDLVPPVGVMHYSADKVCTYIHKHTHTHIHTLVFIFIFPLDPGGAR